MRARWMLGAVFLLATGCLQNDPRPPPGSVLVTASPDPAISSGIVTDDGWTINYQRFLISLGRASAEDEEGTCNQTYSDPDYLRVLDMKAGASQKVNLVYALGKCSLDLELASPWDDSVLGKGTTAADREYMRTPQSDDYVTSGGVSIHAEATATKNGVEKRLAWTYRYRIDYTNVGTLVNGTLVRGMDLQEHEALTMDFPIRGAALFWDQLEGEGTLSFEPMANADADSDGEVTLSELGQVPLSSVADATHYADGAKKKLETLEDYVYRGLFKSVVDANALEMEVFPNDRNSH